MDKVSEKLDEWFTEDRRKTYANNFKFSPRQAIVTAIRDAFRAGYDIAALEAVKMDNEEAIRNKQNKDEQIKFLLSKLRDLQKKYNEAVKEDG